MPEPAARPVSLYSEQTLIPDGLPHCQLLIPFLGNPYHSGYQNLAERGRTFVELTDEKRAELALLPFDGRYLVERHHPVSARAHEMAREFFGRASRAGLRCLVLVNSDSDEPIPFDDVLVLRTSLSRRTRKPYEFALPAWHEDLKAAHLGGQLRLRSKGTRPHVGFCGLASARRPRLKRRVKNLAREVLDLVGVSVPERDGVFLRALAMRALSESARVSTDFIIRDDCFHGLANEAERARQRNEYVENMLDTDYTLCLRGYGNYSFRFFETLSLGRTPLFIDTDCVLPWSFCVDYERYTVTVKRSELRRAGDRVADHFARLDAHTYAERQTTIRRFWEEWLSPEGYFGRLRLHVEALERPLARTGQ
jgi:hypothetical protein